jgi:hypothetical protein
MDAIVAELEAAGLVGGRSMAMTGDEEGELLRALLEGEVIPR